MTDVIEAEAAASVAERPRLFRPYIVAATATVVLILLQAILGGRGLFQNPELIDVHGIVANGVLLVVLVQSVLFVALGWQSPQRGRFLALHLLLIALTIGQIGLGYGGRENGESAAWHVANGVMLFGTGVCLLAILLFVGQPNKLSSTRQTYGNQDVC